ncbi:putative TRANSCRIPTION REGULATOR COLD SHOCK PROTEIN [Mesorhizobium plurifarium]|uniref:Putative TRANSCRIPTION REGULATOR COLD SHOCK PROTEIN n=1 Tax=Mesorhizobium plurifarium TaxID=69974 RepID=A0A090GUL0_MESPL|nr:putative TRANSCRIPTION REGULATOR COLD SHOCK PROTEIN [Mesorhizobium plurifarium]
MSKHKDLRKSRRDRYYDEPFFSEPHPEPSYFQRQSAGTSNCVHAEVKWFNASKGFGFVALADGADAYLHMRVVEAAGCRSVSEGAHLKVILEERPKGRQVAQIVEVMKASTPQRVADRSSVGIGPQSEVSGTVKFYNPERGFGFIAPESGEKDIFVHASVLTRSGLAALVEGQKVFVECAEGKRSLEAKRIRLA